MRCDLQNSVKDYPRGKALRIQLSQLCFGSARQFFVKRNGSPWPAARRPVSITRVLTALRNPIVKAMAEQSTP